MSRTELESGACKENFYLVVAIVIVQTNQTNNTHVNRIL